MNQVTKFGITINTSIGSFYLLTAELVEAARTGGAFRSFTDLPDATLHYTNPATSERAVAFMYRGETNSAKLNGIDMEHLAAAMVTKIAVAMDEAYEVEGMLGSELHTTYHTVRTLLQERLSNGDFPIVGESKVRRMARVRDSVVRKSGDEISIDLWVPGRKVVFTSKDDARPRGKIRNNGLSGAAPAYVGYGREFQRATRQDLELQAVLTFGSKTWVDDLWVVCDVDPAIRLDSLFSADFIADTFAHLAEEHLIGLSAVAVKRIGLGSELDQLEE